MSDTDARIVGVDLGGTKVRVVVATPEGEFLVRRERPTESQFGMEWVVSNIEGLIHEAVKEAGDPPIMGVGVGAPGPLDPHKGVVFSPPNLPGWSNVPLVQILSSRLKLPVYLDNDAKLAGLGEYTYGAGKNHQHMVYITVSTGIGGCVIDEGHMLYGRDGAAAEIGHTSITFDGPLCNCGNIGCLEVMASGTAIRRRAVEMLEHGHRGLIYELSEGGQHKLVNARLVGEAAQQGDPDAIRLLEETGMYLGVGLTNVLHLFNPEIIVIGGGVSQIGHHIFDTMHQTIAQRAMSSYRQNLRIELAALGDNCGLAGCVALVLKKQAQPE